MIIGLIVVRVEGLEPPRLAAPEPKSGASTNFATPATELSLAEAFAECEGENYPFCNFSKAASPRAKGCSTISPYF